ncbi:MAG: 3-phosphoshikimate 1-carboxyvinyltransferase, partial [Flavisolibacter sp.]
EPVEVTGSGSLVKRPLSFFDEVLPKLGVHCTSNQGHLPLHINGPLKPADIEVDGSLSSQFLTGLLFAYSVAGAKDVTIRVNQLNSKPYIDLTLHIMSEFGLPTPKNNDYKEFIFSNGQIQKSTSKPFNFTIESDWSGAAFLLVAGAVAGDIVVKGLDVFSMQADKNILQPLMQAEAIMSITENEISIKRNQLRPFHFNATDCPDLFPPLAALAAHCNGTSVIEGVHRLTHKESNRAETLKEVFGKMGVDIQLQDDLMVIRGGSLIKGTQVSSHHDHRIAMACGVAGLTCTGEMEITNAEAVNKSYPQFWDHLKKLKAEVSLKTIE